MNAITIIQPFAHLITLPESDPRKKRVENRCWALPASMVDRPLAIHAGKATKYLGTPVAELAADYDIPSEMLASGAVVAIATPIGLFRKDAGRMQRVWGILPEWVHTHEHSEGPFGLILRDVKPLPIPLAWPGAQGIWHIPDDVIRAALRNSTSTAGATTPNGPATTAAPAASLFEGASTPPSSNS